MRLLPRTLPFDYAVRNLGRSGTRLLLSVLGSSLVVVLVLAAAAFVHGMDQSMRTTGGEHNVLLLGAGSEESVERSEVEASTAGVLEASVAGIRSRAGVSYISSEVHVQLPARTESGGGGHAVMVRGVTPGAMLVHDQVQIAEGRFPGSGTDEVMIGRMDPTRLGVPDADVALGRSMIIDGKPWKIVGRFVAPGTVMEAEIWVGLTDLKAATKRDTISCVIVTLDPEEAEFADIAAFVKVRPDLELAAMPERAYYARLAAFFGPIRIVAWVTAALIGLGGLLGGLNTMYAAFASRVRELGTLQSLGYRRSAIVLSLVQESVLVTAAGALIAGAAGVLLLDGLSVRFSMGAFGLVVDPTVLGIGLAAGLLLGLVGALPPAWRCLRLAIPVALKAV